MSYKLDARDSKWLGSANDSCKAGPGSYEGANTTQNTWNRVHSIGTRGASRGPEASRLGEHKGSIYDESDQRGRINNAPFNSKINRGEQERLTR